MLELYDVTLNFRQETIPVARHFSEKHEKQINNTRSKYKQYQYNIWYNT